MKTLSAVCLAVLLTCGTTGARPIHVVSFSEQLEKADLVVIARVASPTVHKTDRTKRPNDPIVVKTEFTIDAIWKGDKAVRKFTLSHYEYNDLHSHTTIVDGAGYFRFGKNDGQPYLMFLRQVKDVAGEYVPCTGQYDPGVSIRVLNFASTTADKKAKPMKPVLEATLEHPREAVAGTGLALKQKALGIVVYVPTAKWRDKPFVQGFLVGYRNTLPRWSKSLKKPADRGSLSDAYQKVIGGKPSKSQAFLHAPPFDPKKVKPADWLATILKKKPAPTSETDDNWVLFKSRQMSDNDRRWIERIERHGSTFMIFARHAVWVGPYAKNSTFHEVHGVNLGKLPPGTYEVQWHRDPYTFRKFDVNGWPKDLVGDPVGIIMPRRVRFTVVKKSAKTNANNARHRGFDDLADLMPAIESRLPKGGWSIAGITFGQMKIPGWKPGAGIEVLIWNDLAPAVLGRRAPWVDTHLFIMNPEYRQTKPIIDKPDARSAAGRFRTWRGHPVLIWGDGWKHRNDDLNAAFTAADKPVALKPSLLAHGLRDTSPIVAGVERHLPPRWKLERASYGSKSPFNLATGHGFEFFYRYQPTKPLHQIDKDSAYGEVHFWLMEPDYRPDKPKKSKVATAEKLGTTRGGWQLYAWGFGRKEGSWPNWAAVLVNTCLAGEPEKDQVILLGKQKRPELNHDSIAAWNKKRPEFKSTIQAMEYFRKNPGLVGKEGSDLGLTNGLAFGDKEGGWLPLNSTVYLAKKVPIHDVKDLMILMAYVNEKDLQLRGIAILALDRSLAAYPNGLSAEAVTDVESKRHVQMVERFAQKIAERARGR